MKILVKLSELAGTDLDTLILLGMWTSNRSIEGRSIKGRESLKKS